jgi:hypothetical protein
MNDDMVKTTISFHKQRVERDRADGYDATHPVLDMFRGGRRIGVAFLETEHPAEQLPLIISAFGLDEICLAVDTYFAAEQVNPDTQEPWAPGEMNQYKLEHPDERIIQDSLVFLVSGRDGSFEMFMEPYWLSESQVIWESWVNDEELASRIDESPLKQGYVPDQVRAGFAMDHSFLNMVVEDVKNEKPEASVEYAEAFADVAICYKLAQESIATVMLGCEHDQLERYAVLNKLAESGIGTALE